MSLTIRMIQSPMCKAWCALYCVCTHTHTHTQKLHTKRNSNWNKQNVTWSSSEICFNLGVSNTMIATKVIEINKTFFEVLVNFVSIWAYQKQLLQQLAQWVQQQS